jgi:hemerythrin
MINYAFSRTGKRIVALLPMMIEWNNNMPVGIREFDEHHKRIIDLINRRDASLKTGDDRKVTTEALAELSNYSFYHFFAEEEAMEKSHYVEYRQHKDEHLIFIDKIFHLIEHQQSSKEDTGKELLIFLATWLKNHILKTDKKYTPCLRAGGLT